jgi:hypothetical protein
MITATYWSLRSYFLGLCRRISADEETTLRQTAAVASLTHWLSNDLLDHRFSEAADLGMFGNDIAEWAALALDACLAVLDDHTGGAAELLERSNGTVETVDAWFYRDVGGHLPARLTKIGRYDPAGKAVL